MDKIQPYKDEAGEWRWTRTAPNNEEVGASTEGYKNIQDCMDNLTRVNGEPIDYTLFPPTPLPRVEDTV
jgi:uncharacterized protein YegP (UPF0339 family)